MQKNTSEKKEIKKTLEELIKDFPILYQKKYKISMRYENFISSQKGVFLKLICPTKEGVSKEYTDFGLTKEEAKIKLVTKALQDNILE